MNVHWHTLDRESKSRVLANLRSAGESALFSPATSEVRRAALSFYEGLDLYRLSNHAALPILTMDFLGDGETFAYLDGAAEPILTANRAYGLRPGEESALDYLDFYFSAVYFADGEIQLIRAPEDVPVIEALDESQQQAIHERFTPPAVDFDPERRIYTIRAVLLYNGALMNAKAEIGPEGQVNITETALLLGMRSLPHAPDAPFEGYD